VGTENHFISRPNAPCHQSYLQCIRRIAYANCIFSASVDCEISLKLLQVFLHDKSASPANIPDDGYKSFLLRSKNMRVIEERDCPHFLI
jgi:hypothetical protein